VWKWLAITAAILTAGCLGSGYWLQSSGRLDEWLKVLRPELKPTEVRITHASRGDLVRTVSAPGQVEPKTKVEISAQVSARIIALPFRDNAVVKKGDVVVRLDARDLAALLDSAKAQLKSEEARLEGARASFLNAQLELNRKRELLSTRDVSPAEVDQAQAEFSRAQSNLQMVEHAIDMAKADIRRAEKNLDNTIITAPFDGVIVALNAEVGETVVVGTLNNPGSVIMEIADLSVMVLKARVDEANIAPVKEGQRARIYVNAFPDRTFTGTVELVSLKRQVDRDGTAYFETEILVDLPEGVLLRSGLTANADIEVETFRDVIRIPSQAVLDRPVDELPKAVTDGNPNIQPAKKFARVVYVMDGTKARPVPVTVGPSDLTHTLILGGLEPDAAVISGPFKALVNLKHDQLVAEQSATPAPGAKPDTTPDAKAAGKTDPKPAG
jgi:HlyD family secretion protein